LNGICHNNELKTAATNNDICLTNQRLFGDQSSFQIRPGRSSEEEPLIIAGARLLQAK